MGRLEEIKKKFQILDDWTIIIGLDRTLDGTPYTGQCTVNSDKHIAVIYPWHADGLEPFDYVLHETLHIACRSALIDREHEESFVQDLCTQFKERDQEIERLKQSIKESIPVTKKMIIEGCDNRIKIERLRQVLKDIKVMVFKRWVANMPGRRILEIIDKELKGK